MVYFLLVVLTGQQVRRRSCLGCVRESAASIVLYHGVLLVRTAARRCVVD